MALATVAVLAASANPAHAKIEKLGMPGHTVGLSCVSNAECVAAVDTSDSPRKSGAAVRFDPTSGGRLGTTTLNLGFIQDIFCSTRTQCTSAGGDHVGSQRFLQAATFDPTAATGPRALANFADPDPINAAFQAISCPTSSQCTAVDLKGRVLTFDPNALAGTPTPPQDQYRVLGIDCPTTTVCVLITDNLVDRGGDIRTFDPANPAAQIVTRLSSGVFGGIDCPSATQCTVTDKPGNVVTFDPEHPADHGPPVAVLAHANDGNDNLGDVSCPSTIQCTAPQIQFRSHSVITFNPKNPKVTKPDDIAVTNGGRVDCPTVTQCTLLADREVVTLNPQSPATSVASPATSLATPKTIVKLVAVVPKAKRGAKVTTTLRLGNKLLKKRSLKVASDHSIVYRVGKLSKTGTYTVKFTIGRKVVATKKVKVSAR